MPTERSMRVRLQYEKSLSLKMEANKNGTCSKNKVTEKSLFGLEYLAKAAALTSFSNPDCSPTSTPWKPKFKITIEIPYGIDWAYLVDVVCRISIGGSLHGIEHHFDKARDRFEISVKQWEGSCQIIVEKTGYSRELQIYINNTTTSRAFPTILTKLCNDIYREIDVNVSTGNHITW